MPRRGPGTFSFIHKGTQCLRWLQLHLLHDCQLFHHFRIGNRSASIIIDMAVTVPSFLHGLLPFLLRPAFPDYFFLLIQNRFNQLNWPKEICCHLTPMHEPFIILTLSKLCCSLPCLPAHPLQQLSISRNFSPPPTSPHGLPNYVFNQELT